MRFNGYVCDKCGKLVPMDEVNSEKMEISMFTSTDKANQNLKLRAMFKERHGELISSSSYGSRTRISKDLCFECSKELFAWFENKVEPKKEEPKTVVEPPKKVKPQAYPWTPNGGNRVAEGTIEKKYEETKKVEEPAISDGCSIEDFLEDILKKYYPSKKVTRKDGRSYDVAKHHRTLLYNWAVKNFKTIEELMKCKRVEDTDYKQPMNNQMVYDLKNFLKKEGF